MKTVLEYNFIMNGVNIPITLTIPVHSKIITVGVSRYGNSNYYLLVEIRQEHDMNTTKEITLQSVNTNLTIGDNFKFLSTVYRTRSSTNIVSRGRSLDFEIDNYEESYNIYIDENLQKEEKRVINLKKLNI